MNTITKKMLLCAMSCNMVAFGQQRRHTFLTVERPVFQSGSPEREVFTRAWRHGDISFIQVVPFFGHSRLPEQIARYFLPLGRQTLLVTGDLSDSSETRDLCADHFNIRTVKDTFKSELLFKASHEFAGLGLAWRQCFTQNWWVEAGIPFLQVKNRMRFKEIILNNGGGPLKEKGLDNSPFVGSMTEAFKQKSWRYGKIDSSLTHVREGVGDLELKLGYQSTDICNVALTGYAGIIIPTSNKPEGIYVFEPMLGNNGHFGFLLGSQTGLDIWCYNEHKLALIFDLNTRYLLSNHQIRSFDLRDKEFSSYIASYNSPEQAELAAATLNPFSGTSGINIYTQSVKATPGFSVTFNNALNYIYQCWEIEAGYNFFARQNENISIDWQKTADIQDVGGIGGTNRARTISQNFSASVIPVEQYFPLRGSDLDLTSAASPAIISYTFYGAVGYYVRDGDLPVLLGIGGSYEATGNFGVNRWSVWGKAVVSF